ncbi:MAG TPA: SRPBCC family protein [Solirubrobacteraceae bacterium]|nr:SRPBCC family protein [Solirubrobacteraceae bacterium]
MHLEAEITVERPRAEVFDYIARGEKLPEYVTDFSWVKQDSDGEPTLGTTYSYKMARGAEGTFDWTEFEPSSRLAWHGPPVKAGPGSMEPSGRWELADAGTGTRVKLVMTPKPGGLFRMMAPLMAMQMRKGNDAALQRLKGKLEG